LALPVIAGERLVAVLYVESAEDGDIDHDDEDALTLLAEACARAFGAFSESDEADEAATVDTSAPLAGPAMLVSHDEDDHSVFVDDEYLIKGVAGAILWRMLRDYVELGRVEFNNKDLRRDRALGLPDVGDNLEARLVLLQRRLRERLPDLALDKTGRGRYQLRVARPLRLATPRG
jgi:adenylate cyclase